MRIAICCHRLGVDGWSRILDVTTIDTTFGVMASLACMALSVGSRYRRGRARTGLDPDQLAIIGQA